MGGSTGSALMNPMGTGQQMMGTLSDPQKLISGFVGPTAAGIKPPPGQAPPPKAPGGPAITPESFGDLKQKYSVGGGGGGMMDDETSKFLQMLAGGR